MHNKQLKIKKQIQPKFLFVPKLSPTPFPQHYRVGDSVRVLQSCAGSKAHSKAHGITGLAMVSQRTTVK